MMKRKIGRLALITALFLLGITGVAAQSGGGFEITSSTIDGGGGNFSGGSYQLSGTAGQPDAGYTAGSSYELFGGFWQGASDGPTSITLYQYTIRPDSETPIVLFLIALSLSVISVWWIRAKGHFNGRLFVI